MDPGFWMMKGVVTDDGNQENGSKDDRRGDGRREEYRLKILKTIK